MTTTPPAQPREGALIEAARERRVPRISIRKLAELAGISDARWRQIEKGYSTPRRGYHIPVTAPPETLGRMAHAVDVSAKELREAGRDDAADWFDNALGVGGEPAPLVATRVETGGYEGLELAIEGTPPELRAFALSLALDAIESVKRRADQLQPKERNENE